MANLSSRFPPLLASRLGRMQVLETIDSDALIRARLLKFKERWIAHDPPLGAEYDVDALEFDPIVINQEANSYFETMLRDRVNQAARAVTLAYATGNDLDAIGSRYPNPAARQTLLSYARDASYIPTQPLASGVPRLALVADPRGTAMDFPQDWEDDERYRRRLWLAASTFSTAGSEDAYVFWALTAVPQLRDATATVVRPSRRETPVVVVTLLREGADPKPTPQQIVDVHTVLHRRDVRPATDVVQVRPPGLLVTDYSVELTLYPSANPITRKAAVETAVAELIEGKRFLGEDHTLMAIEAACAQNEVQNCRILSPTNDVKAGPTQFVKVNSVSVRVTGYDE
jgi:phage-related baseplate assembly protein